jgi:hypothetical protein
MRRAALRTHVPSGSLPLYWLLFSKNNVTITTTITLRRHQPTPSFFHYSSKTEFESNEEEHNSTLIVTITHPLRDSYKSTVQLHQERRSRRKFLKQPSDTDHDDKQPYEVLLEEEHMEVSRGRKRETITPLEALREVLMDAEKDFSTNAARPGRVESPLIAKREAINLIGVFEKMIKAINWFGPGSNPRYLREVSNVGAPEILPLERRKFLTADHANAPRSTPPSKRQRDADLFRALKAREGAENYLKSHEERLQDLKRPTTLDGWGGLVEARIREAMADWKPTGKPQRALTGDEDENPYIDNTTRIMNRIMIKNGCLPPWIELEKEIGVEMDMIRLDLLRIWKDWKEQVGPLGYMFAGHMRYSSSGYDNNNNYYSSSYSSSSSSKYSFSSKKKSGDNNNYSSTKNKNADANDHLSWTERIKRSLAAALFNINDNNNINNIHNIHNINNNNNDNIHNNIKNNNNNEIYEKFLFEKVGMMKDTFKQTEQWRRVKGLMEARVKQLNSGILSYNLMVPSMYMQKFPFDLETELAHLEGLEIEEAKKEKMKRDDEMDDDEVKEQRC